ncbi:hypothetical protein HOY80DRAFT_956494 [Tuber brumale]|nr:hypothetical protein HOY80DRAFT_956494 [Tuber brumale]
MPLITWLKTHSTRRQKKLYTSFRTEASPPPLSRKNASRLHTPSYTSPSAPHPPSRPVSPHTPCRTSGPAPPAFSKLTPSIPPHTVSPLTPPESIHSNAESWISCSESTLRGNRASDIRLHRDSAGINSVVLGESSPKRGGSPGGHRGRNSGVIPTPPQTPTPSSKCWNSGHHDDGDVYVYVPILPDSDNLHPLAGRKEELVDLFTLHGPVYGEEWRLRSEYGKTKRPGARAAAEDIESVNEELMNEYAIGDEGYNEMWTLLLEGGG